MVRWSSSFSSFREKNNGTMALALPPVVVEIVGYLLLFFLVFGMSASLDLNAMVHQLKNTKAITLGLCGQFVLLPFLGFVAAKAFQLDNAMGMSLLVVTSSPGGSYSNWVSRGWGERRRLDHQLRVRKPT